MSSTDSDSAARGSRLAPVNTPRVTATPNRRGISADAPPSAYLSASARRRGFQANTPHAQAARREIDERRRTLFTPGRSRRRSLRDQRETPRDFLRNLSRALAPRTERIHYSSSSVASSPESAASSSRRGPEPSPPELDDDDDDFIRKKPRFSLPINDDDDDDMSVMKPPRISILRDDEYTSASIELARRVSRMDRMSLESERRRSAFDGPNIIPSDAENTIGQDSGFIPPPAFGNDEETGAVAMDEDGITDIERVDDEAARRRQALLTGRESDFPPIEIPDIGAEESTFMMAPIESSPVRPTGNDTVVEEADNQENEDYDQGDYDMPPGIGDDDGYESDGNEPMPEPDYYDDEDQDRNSENNNDEDGDRPEEPTADIDITRATTATDYDETMLSSRGDAFLERQAARRGSAPAPMIAKLTPGKKTKKISRHGIEYPSLPQGVVKRLATTFARSAGIPKAKITGDTLAAIMQASDWFFEQLGDDLAAYAKHAGRKTIDESDMLTLMRRQRQTKASMTPFALAHRHLPRELLQEIRMPAPAPVKSSRKTGSRRSGENEEVT